MREFRFILGRRALIVFLALLVATGALLGVPAATRTLAESPPPVVQEASAASGDSVAMEGPLLSSSGHSSLLQGGSTTGIWTETNTPITNTPTARCEHAMAATPSGVLLFGGWNNYDAANPQYFAGTWLFNTATNSWTKTNSVIEDSTNTPSVRHGHAMAALPGGDVLLFGGRNRGVPVENFLGDTWLFNTTTGTWGAITSSPSNPSARTYHAMATTPSGVLLFGGQQGSDSAARNDTWFFTYDYITKTGTWTETNTTGHNSTNTPAARYLHAMAATPSGVLLFGGYNGTTYLNDTWLFNTATNSWSQRTTSPTPQTRKAHAMAATPSTATSSGDVLLFGGYSTSYPNYLNDTWFFDTSAGSWSQLTTSSTPPARYGHAMAATPSGVLLFGGLRESAYPSYPYPYLNDTWLFNQGEEPTTHTISVTSPTAGATWVVGTDQNITWTSAGLTGTLTIQLARDEVHFTETLTTGVTNTATQYTWTVTGLASTNCLIRVTDGTTTGTSGEFTITHAASPDSVSLSPATATIVAGTTQAYTATAYDSYGNSWDITALTAFSISPNGSFSGNVASVSLAGPHTVTGSYGGKSATASLQVTPGAPHHFTFSTIAVQTAGTPFPVTITAYDSFNNVKTDFTGPATLSGFANSVNPTSIPFIAGVANPTLTITKAMAGVLTITSASISNDSNTFTVNPVALDHLSLSPATATIVAGTTQAYTATAFDSYGNSWDVTALTTFSISPNGSFSGNVASVSLAGPTPSPAATPARPLLPRWR